MTLSDWPTLGSSVPQVAAVGGIALLVGLVVAFILTILFQPIEYAVADGYAPYDADRHGLALGALSESMSPLSAPGPILADRADPPTDTTVLCDTVLSPSDTAALASPRQRIEVGDLSELFGPARDDPSRWFRETDHRN